jgi:hypothetical protein
MISAGYDGNKKNNHRHFEKQNACGLQPFRKVIHYQKMSRAFTSDDFVLGDGHCENVGGELAIVKRS